MKKLFDFFKILGINKEDIDTKTRQVQEYNKVYVEKDDVSLVRTRYILYKSMNSLLKKMLGFMSDTLRLENKKEDIFYLLRYDENNVVLKNFGGTRDIKLNTRLEDIGDFCEITYYQRPHLFYSRFKKFQIEYIVKIDEENGECVVASPEAMEWNGIDSFYGIRFVVRK